MKETQTHGLQITLGSGQIPLSHVWLNQDE